VGRTVPSFSITSEIERTKWKQFRSILDKLNRKMFDEMYDYVKLHNMACMMACKPVVIHSGLVSILFEHYKQLHELNDKLDRKAASQLTANLDKWVFR
jgi:DNA phosphorothioation-dependent restriction protein DptG